MAKFLTNYQLLQADMSQLQHKVDLGHRSLLGTGIFWKGIANDMTARSFKSVLEEDDQSNLAESEFMWLPWYRPSSILWTGHSLCPPFLGIYIIPSVFLLVLFYPFGTILPTTFFDISF